MPKASPDYLTEEQAGKLAKQIAQFWHDKGHSGVRVWVEKFVSGPEARITNSFCVRSNLVRGMPQP
jgi:hypothetical protein